MVIAIVFPYVFFIFTYAIILLFLDTQVQWTIACTYAILYKEARPLYYVSTSIQMELIAIEVSFRENSFFKRYIF